MTRTLSRHPGNAIYALIACLSTFLAHPALAQTPADAVRTYTNTRIDKAWIVEAAMPVNGDDARVQLTRKQLWTGLVMRTREPGVFVAAYKTCDVVQDGAIALVRSCPYDGMRFTDLITFFPMKMIRFESLDYPDNHSMLEYLIENRKEDSLVLHFRFTYTGPAQRTDAVREAFLKRAANNFAPVVTHTLARIRELAVAGRLSESLNARIHERIVTKEK